MAVKINLRKASAAVLALTSEVTALRLALVKSANQDISIYDKEEKISILHEKYKETYVKFIDYTNTLYEIRLKVGEANASSLVNAKLAEINKIDMLTSAFSILAKAEPIERGPLSEKIAHAKSRLESENGMMYGASDKVSTSILEVSDIEIMNAANLGIKRRKRELQDDILALNINIKIELGDVAEKVLKELAII